MLVFVKGGKPEIQEKNPRSKARTNKRNLHMGPAGIEPRPHWWEASALNTAPPLPPSPPNKSSFWLVAAGFPLTWISWPIECALLEYACTSSLFEESKTPYLTLHWESVIPIFTCTKRFSVSSHLGRCYHGNSEGSRPGKWLVVMMAATIHKLLHFM